MNVFVKSAAIVLSVAMLWGCSSTPKTTAPAAGVSTGAATTAAPASTPAPMTSTVDTGASSGGAQMAADELSAPGSLLAKRTVYFDFDKSDIKPEARQIIEAHAKYLAAHPNTHITLEGHCDERGTREYNLGLGERRARAVQQVMTLLGASSGQLKLVSYGEERPVAAGHDESAWALNRRVEFVY